MTEKEARKIIGEITLNRVSWEELEAMNIALKALEKQIPKEPHYDGDGYAPDGSFVWDEWLCPRCNSRFEVDYDKYDYCPNCGQAIKWE